MKLMNDESGYTLMEVMVTLLLSVGVMITIVFIPLRISESYRNYTQEFRTNMASHRVQKTLNDDIRTYYHVVENAEGLEIGGNQYFFKEDGLYRDNIQVSVVPVTYELNEDLLTITSSSDNEDETDIKLKFLLENSSYLERGDSE